MADQLDDWKDYQRLKTIDRGEDFAFLRELVSSPITGMSEYPGHRDSGYFSRRGSKASRKLEETPDLEGGEEHFSRRTSSKLVAELKEQEDADDGNGGYFSRQNSGLKFSTSAPSSEEAIGEEDDDTDDVEYNDRKVSESISYAELMSDIEFTFVAEGTPPSTGDDVESTPIASNAVGLTDPATDSPAGLTELQQLRKRQGQSAESGIEHSNG